MVADLRRGFADLDTKPAEEQSRVLHSQLAEVRLGSGQAIKLVLWLPDLVVAGVPEGASMTPETKEPVPAGVSPSGHGFAWRSKMVEAPGIENSLIISRHHATRCNILQNLALTPTDGEDAKSASSDIRQVYGEEFGGSSRPAEGEHIGCMKRPPGKMLRRRWLLPIDDRRIPVVEYGFAVTTDPWRIEQIGRTVARFDSVEKGIQRVTACTRTLDI